MTFDCSVREFSDAFNWALQFTDKQTGSVYFKYEKKKTYLYAFNGGIGARVRIDAQLKKGDEDWEGFDTEYALPKEMKQVCSNASDRPFLWWTYDNGAVIVTGEGYRYEFPVREDVGTPIEIIKGTEIKLKLKEFQQGIRQTIFSTDSENAHYALNGVALDFNRDDNTVYLVSTNGRTLARYELDVLNSIEIPSGFNTIVLPPTVLNAIANLKIPTKRSDEEVEATIIISESRATIKIQFDDNERIITTALIAGRFPNWKSIIPNRDELTPIVFSVEYLIDSVKQAMVTTDEKQVGITFDFNGEHTSYITSGGGEKGKSRIALRIESKKNPTIAVRVDPKYILSFLTSLEFQPAKKVSLYIDGKDKPLLFVDDSYRFVVMPLA